MIDRQNIFNHPVKNNSRTYHIIRSFVTGQGDDYAIGCVLDYNYFQNYYKMIAIDFSKQQVFEAASEAIQQINFTGCLQTIAMIFFIIEEAIKNGLRFFTKSCKMSLVLYFALIPNDSI